MSSNREKRVYAKSVHLFMALQREPKKGNKNCFRTVIKDEELDLKMMEAKCKVFGGKWRIHKTVNERDIEKARIWLIKHLLDNPKNASFVDSCWRTALLQKECIYGTQKWMLDVDTKDVKKIQDFHEVLNETGAKVYLQKETPNGFHYIIAPMDTRKICKLDYVTLLRDGYIYVKTIGESNGS